MNFERLDELQSELSLILADSMSDKPMIKHYKTVVDRISSLNQIIDDYDDKGNDEYNLLIGFAYQYYRFRDEFITI